MPVDAETTVLSLREQVEAFVHERAWEQFHNPKDLAAAIAIEAAELQELLLWKSPQEVSELVRDEQMRGNLADELADVVILCLSMANQLNIDITQSITSKMASNAAKYPVDKARGRHTKYTDL